MESETNRASDFEGKYAEARQTSEETRKKLEEMEGKGNQLQESLTRYLLSISFYLLLYSLSLTSLIFIQIQTI